ncbi:hypothetical protein PPL_07997 [Heterostelium album PN500]|uniref:Uncharacterized protein n=1 Tax=Heterostelium pallidum (strain ATCC 26659 / Pp 5 / PN500) TaxID=670386 RepID=D3BHJ4_HETP5|nr:hypothetical protein PPL_07997 [Heterostelium album PN500]EFA79171.1 hypothetical protein PPL_07997 [Heterostelium album PN500]|eukprot:XP_020431292.1 hypothetical protein PPL_07997 [Heterostelium album PN500]
MNCTESSTGLTCSNYPPLRTLTLCKSLRHWTKLWRQIRDNKSIVVQTLDSYVCLHIPQKDDPRTIVGMFLTTRGFHINIFSIFDMKFNPHF